MRVLVTGAAGMLGRALMPALAAAGHEARGGDVTDLDVTDPDAVLRAARGFRPEWIVHLAAFTKVDECEARADEALRVNADGAGHVAAAAAAVDARLLALSTDYVFDGAATRPYREDDAPGPLSAYGRSKLAGEARVEAALRGRPHVILRTSWLFGAGGANFVDTILAKARAGERLRVVDDQRGSPTYTVDLAEGLLRLVTAGAAGTYHCTNTGDCTWHDLAAHALACAGLRVPLERTDTAAFPRPARRPAYSVLSNDRFRQATGWTMPDWRDAVTRHVTGGTGRTS